MKTIALFLAALLGFAIHDEAAANVTIYQTSFEPPAFTPGVPIREQDNWEMYHDGEGISVATNNARTGIQCLRFDGALLEQDGPNHASAYCFSRALDTLTNNPPPIVEITASVRLDGPQTGTNSTPDQDILSANLMAVVPKPGGQGELIGGFFVSSAGRIWTYSRVEADNYRFSVPYVFGTYRTLKLRMDFIARQITYFVDGVQLGSAPFLSSIPAERPISGYLFLSGALDPINTPELTYDPAAYTAYFDDYSLVSVPLSPVNAIIEFGAMSWPYTNFLCDEFESAARVRVTRRGFINAAVRVTLTTTNGTAIAGQDYGAASTFVTFAAGETNKEVQIPLLADDYWAEPDKTFNARITDLPPGATSPRPAATIIIRDNERPGSIDYTWSSNLGLPPLGPNEIKYADPHLVLQQPDGKLIVDVWVIPSDFGYPLYWRLVRINPDGSVDPTYPIRDSVPSPGGHLFDRRIAVMPNGKLLVWDSEESGTAYLGYRVRYLLNPDGSQDYTFPSLSSGSGGGLDLIPQPDGKILVSGSSVSPLLNGQRMPWLFRLNNNGTLDTNFNAPTNISGSVRLLPNGQLWVEKYGVQGNLRRLNNDGSLDALFTAPANLVLNFLHSLSNGQWLVTSPLSNSRKLYRLNQNGSLDPGFIVGTAVGFNAFNSVGSLDYVLPQSDGKLIVAGIFRTYNGQVCNSIVRLNPDGSVDSSFQTGQGFVGVAGNSTDPGQLGQLRQLPDGGLFLGGNYETFDGEKVTPPIILNSNGTRDPSFEGTLVDLGGVSAAYGALGPDNLFYFANGYGLGRLQMNLPLRIVSNERETNGTTHLTANALTGHSYTLQIAETLTNWTDLITQLATTNRIEIIDTLTNSPTIRFYRVKQN